MIVKYVTYCRFLDSSFVSFILEFEIYIYSNVIHKLKKVFQQYFTVTIIYKSHIIISIYSRIIS